jgi:hypothetical protein
VRELPFRKKSIEKSIDIHICDAMVSFVYPIISDIILLISLIYLFGAAGLEPARITLRRSYAYYLCS